MQFAFSFNRQTFHGRYPSRAEALAAAVQHLRGRESSVEALYVGQWVPGDAMTTDHAEEVLDSMRRRARRAEGDESFLKDVNEQQLADLDAGIARAVADWLSRHDRVPASTRLRGVTEHAVPTPLQHAPDGDDIETRLLGPEA